jgi:hypothetical protein
MTTLDSQRRGDPFEYRFTLGNGWTSASFSEVRFTLRRRYPASSIVTDTDSDVVDQATLGEGEITFESDTVGLIEFPSSRTTAWPALRLLWDLQGTVAGASPAASRTIDSGEIMIDPDVTRTP